jgi:hypothetical protein
MPDRRAVGAKNAPRDRRHLAHGSAECLLRAAALRPNVCKPGMSDIDVMAEVEHSATAEYRAK